MTLRVALASAPISLHQRYGPFASVASTQPSFGLACLAAVALRAGALVRIVDAAAESLTVDAALAEILAFQPHVVGLSATTAGIVACGELAMRVKAAAPDTLILVGGSHLTALPEETLLEFPGIDVGVVGEGEETLVEVLGTVAQGNIPADTIPGTVVRVSGAIQLNPRRPVIEDLDTLPFPAWSLLRGFPHAFRPSPQRIRRFPCASVVLTRGCPNRCLFCDRGVFGNRCRSYSPSYAVAMLKELRDSYGVREILVEDDTFVVVKRRVVEFCERLIADKVGLSWSCLGRADSVTPELLRLMRRAGCRHISFGIESGDPDILKAMGKNLDLAMIEQAVRWSREAGLQTKGFFMVGFPRETEASLAATRSFAKRLKLDDISVMQLTPFPGTDLYSMAGQFGTFERDWEKMSTLETVFVPHGFTKEDLERARARLLREFYLRPQALWSKIKTIAGNPRTAWGMLKGLWALVRVIADRSPKKSVHGNSAWRKDEADNEKCPGFRKNAEQPQVIRNHTRDRFEESRLTHAGSGRTKEFSNPLVSVVVATMDKRELLARCLEHIFRQDYAPFEVIVVDNGSREELQSMLAERFPSVRMIRHERNLGFAGGYNSGIRAARGEFVAILNNDAFVSATWLRTLVTAMQADHSVAAAASVIFEGDPPERSQAWGVGVALDGMSRQRLHPHSSGAAAAVEEVLVVSGCACLFRMDALREVGLFDEDFFAYCEDTDLGLRLQWAGWKSVLVPGASVEHAYSGTMGRFSLHKVLWVERNHYWVAVKNFPLALLPLVPVMTVWRFLVQLFAVVTKAGNVSGFTESSGSLSVLTTVARATGEAFHGIPRILRKRGIERTSHGRSGWEMTRRLVRHRMPLSEIILGPRHARH